VSKISSIWFADNQRSISTAIGGISIALGSIIGFVLPNFFLKDEYNVHKEEGKKKVGEIGFNVNDGDLFIEDLQIPKDLQGKGYGKATIEKLKELPGVKTISGQPSTESKGFWKKVKIESTPCL
jgi:hypothetical protein